MDTFKIVSIILVTLIIINFLGFLFLLITPAQFLVTLLLLFIISKLVLRIYSPESHPKKIKKKHEKK